MTTAHTQTPKKLNAGDSYTWRLSRAEFPASDGWEIIYAFVKEGKLIAVNSTPDEDEHIFTIPATDSADYPPGFYKYQAYAKKGESRITFLNGSIEILPNFLSLVDGHDSRTQAEQILDTLWNTYKELAAKSLASKSSGGTSTADKELADIRAEIQQQEVVVAREKERERYKQTGKRKNRTIKACF